MKVQLVCLCLLAFGSLAYAADKNFDYEETGKSGFEASLFDIQKKRIKIPKFFWFQSTGAIEGVECIANGKFYRNPEIPESGIR